MLKRRKVRKYDGVSTGSWVAFQRGKETESGGFKACFIFFLVGRVSFLSFPLSFFFLYRTIQLGQNTHAHTRANTHTFISFQILESSPL